MLIVGVANEITRRKLGTTDLVRKRLEMTVLIGCDGDGITYFQSTCLRVGSASAWPLDFKVTAGSWALNSLVWMVGRGKADS